MTKALLICLIQLLSLSISAQYTENDSLLTFEGLSKNEIRNYLINLGEENPSHYYAQKSLMHENASIPLFVIGLGTLIYAIDANTSNGSGKGDGSSRVLLFPAGAVVLGLGIWQSQLSKRELGTAKAIYLERKIKTTPNNG